MDRKVRSKRQGVAALGVVSSLSVLMLVIALTTGYIHCVMLDHSRHDVLDAQATHVAEAGLQVAALQLRSDASLSDTVATGTLSDLSANGYSVNATNNVDGISEVTAPDGTSVPPRSVYLLSTGTTGVGSGREVVRQVRGLMRRGAGYFRSAIFGDRTITLMGGATVDSWDSATGPYAPPDSPTVGTYVGTNSTRMSLLGNAYVDGNLLLGPDANTETGVRGQGEYTGVVEAMPAIREPLILEPPTGTAITTDLTNLASQTLLPGIYSSDVSVQSQNTLTMVSGVYYFQGDFSLGGGAVLQVDATDGPVIVYIDGDWDSSGGTIVNNPLVGGTPLASNFQLYGTASCTSVKLAGGTQTALVAYAWNADVTVTGTADLSGAVYGRTVTISGTSRIHYDRQLATLSPPGPNPLGLCAVQRL